MFRTWMLIPTMRMNMVTESPLRLQVEGAYYTFGSERAGLDLWTRANIYMFERTDD